MIKSAREKKSQPSLNPLSALHLAHLVLNRRIRAFQKAGDRPLHEDLKTANKISAYLFDDGAELALLRDSEPEEFDAIVELAYDRLEQAAQFHSMGGL